MASTAVGRVCVELKARAREVVRLGAGVMGRAVGREKVTRLLLLARQRGHDKLGGHCVMFPVINGYECRVFAEIGCC